MRVAIPRRDRASDVLPVLVIIGSVIIAMTAFSIFAAIEAKAHSWYETACCSDHDCEPADAAVKDVPGGLEVEGFGFFPSDDPRVRWSQDAEAHLCVSQGSRNILCIYRRPGGV
jgi:hypothetical protein